ncbi:hypothetical protein AgCh_005479 [Apium graveolens]
MSNLSVVLPIFPYPSDQFQNPDFYPQYTPPPTPLYDYHPLQLPQSPHIYYHIQPPPEPPYYFYTSSEAPYVFSSPILISDTVKSFVHQLDSKITQLDAKLCKISKLIEEKKRAAHLSDPVQVNNFEGSPEIFEGSSPYQNIQVEANKQWEDTHGQIIHVLEDVEKRLADLSNPVEEMSANEVSWYANTHTLVSNFGSLDYLCRVEKIVDDDSDDLKQLKVS